MPRDLIRVWRLPDAPGVDLRRGFRVRAPIARHWHEEYQLCLIEGGGGELRQGGTAHPTPAGSLFVVAPGEVHANESRHAEGCSFRSMYLHPTLLAQAAAEVGGAGLPDFPQPMIDDPVVIARFRDAHRALEMAALPLERDAMLLQALVALVGRHACGRREAQAAGRERAAVRQARQYLDARFREAVSLRELARVAGLSPFHFTRVFRAEVGLPPHAYQTQLRIHYARRLIEAGRPLAVAAQMAGFADQSHLTRQFRRTLAVPPGAYRGRQRKPVQQSTASRE